jgi:hypothetical protein
LRSLSKNQLVAERGQQSAPFNHDDRGKDQKEDYERAVPRILRIDKLILPFGGLDTFARQPVSSPLLMSGTAVHRGTVVTLEVKERAAAL